MKNVVLASMAIAIFGLAGCTSGGGSILPGVTGAGQPTVVYKAPPPAPADSGASQASSGGGNAALCASKGGSVSTWTDVSGEGSTQNCELANGSAFPLAQLTAFPEFQ